MCFRLVRKSVNLDSVMTLILRYFTEFGSFRAHCVKVVEDVVVKKLTFATSSPNEFLVYGVMVGCKLSVFVAQQHHIVKAWPYLILLRVLRNL